jgi:predicted anti-sigma-YlaC factor YlaD
VSGQAAGAAGGAVAEMGCQELVELVTSYLEGALSTGDRQRFDAHLAECEGCRRYVEQVRITIMLTRRLGEPAERPAIPFELIDAFRNWRQG